ncbi:Hypothetical protein R9X50_00262300 [Acrodontium crateriforme]|uniref:DNA replication regulator Sld3 C-terminal domain-containing protein n=1 Tax=Acrodontium crateriforme TaxID=150365 RepID=A0AAQ3R967_9PEZI|nr:Hypothetical protein R9X50_00262300 [Acrodontium crateriforme]
MSDRPIRPLEVGGSDPGIACVLIAEESQYDHLYAIEKISHRVYSLCRLVKWVDNKDIIERSRHSSESDEWLPKRRALHSVENARPWWARAAIEVSLSVQEVDHLPELRMNKIQESNTQPTSSSWPRIEVPIPIDTPLQEQAGLESIDQSDIQPPTAQESFQELAKHYMETLYLSRTSLAYFVKGPLSRARAAFSTTSHPSLSVLELVGFLREAVLPSTAMDKKYREGISSIIKELPAVNTESPEKSLKSKKKRKWRTKRDKLGFFVDEKDFVERWWLADDGDDNMNPNESKDAAIQRRSARLRTRETHLQIIFVLEVLALESAGANDNQQVNPAGVEESQASQTQAEDTQANGEGKKSRAKKQQDLKALLETFIDRLCIWQSVEETSPSKNEDAEKNSDASNSDALRSFCIEIIIPFYMSRIPKYAAAANKKLGGPTTSTPAKQKPIGGRKPGEPAFRQAPEKKPRKSLSRVMTDTQLNSTTKPPMLHRSATDTAALHIKEESGTDVPLASIPSRKSRRPVLTARNHASLMQSISTLSRREVDLHAMSAANEAKIKKKADADAKLREALAMIKKPNRALANKEIAESTDLSFAKATAKSRPTTKARPAKTFDIEATPKQSRMIQATPARGRAEMHAEKTALFSSGPSVIPASAQMSPPRRSNLFTIPQTAQKSKRTTANVQETPSRGFAKFMPLGLAHEPGTLPESPIATRRGPDFLQETPVRQTSRDHASALPLSEFEDIDTSVQATPFTKRPAAPTARDPVNHVVEASPEMVRRRPSVEKAQPTPSIYATLGWDDNDYDDLT